MNLSYYIESSKATSSTNSKCQNSLESRNGDNPIEIKMVNKFLKRQSAKVTTPFINEFFS